MSEVLREVKLALKELVPAADFKVLRSNPDPAAKNRAGVGPYVARTVIVSYMEGSLAGTGLNQTKLREFVRDVLDRSTVVHSITHVRFEEREQPLMRVPEQAVRARDGLIHFERGDIIEVVEEYGENAGRVTVGKALDARSFPGFSAFSILDSRGIRHDFNLNSAKTEVIYPVELMR